METAVAISIVSAGISASSDSIAYASYRRGGPRLKIKAVVRRDPDGPDLLLDLKLHNRGLAPVRAKTVHFGWLAGAYTIENSDFRAGPDLPYELKANDGDAWLVSLREPLHGRQHETTTRFGSNRCSWASRSNSRTA